MVPSEGRGFEKLFRALRQSIGSSARHHAESWCSMYMLTTRWETVLRGTCSAISRAWATQCCKPFLCLSGPPRLWALPRAADNFNVKHQGFPCPDICRSYGRHFESYWFLSSSCGQQPGAVGIQAVRNLQYGFPYRRISVLNGRFQFGQSPLASTGLPSASPREPQRFHYQKKPQSFA